jgi:ribonucleoside-diphosphate reductase alpha chain
MTDQELPPFQSYLESKGVTEKSASASVLSDAKAYESCYNWYITNQKVLPENAALASTIWVNKYALHDSNSMCLEKTPEDMWHRIAKVLAEEEVKTNKVVVKSLDDWENYFYDALEGFKYTPQGSGMFSLGNPYVNASASNCFVLPPPNDSLESIFDTAKSMAKIYAMRGGCGHDISNLRPSGAKTSNAAKTSTGAFSFMDFFSYVTGLIGQLSRRGALLLSIRVDHPDIFNFIRVKRDLDKKPFFDAIAENGVDINDYRWSAIADRVKSVSSANISVKLTDKFIDAVKKDLDFELYYDFEDNKYPRISRIVKAKDIWDELMRSAHESAEPGIFNWDHIVRESIPGKYGKGVFEGEEYDLTDTTSNPCGEIVMSPDSCCLGSFFLPTFVKNPYTSNAEFDWNEYRRIVAIGVRSQDNIKTWDLSKDFLLPVHKLNGKIARRLGLGNHGLADCLAMLGIKYNTQEGIDMAESIYTALKETAYSTSVDLAEEKGPIPIFDWATHSKSPFIQRLPTELQKRIKTKGIRNIAMLTNAPTGSVSILSRNCSSGIEPVFMKSYTRNVKIPGTNNFEQRSIPHQAVADCIAAGGDPSVFIETYEIAGPERVKMQAAIQQHIDHSISVTTNLPATATVEEVSELYMAAFDAGCKGFTIYRDGSRTGVLVSNNKTAKSMKSNVIERPKSTDIDIHKTKYKDKSYMILVGKVNGVPCEVFGGEEKGLSLPTQYKSASLTKKSRGQYSLSVQLSDDEDDILKVNNIGNLFPAGDIITLTRMISLSLRNGINMADIVEQLGKASSVLYDSPAVFARILKLYVPDEDILEKERSKGKKCPECGELLEFRRESGCVSEFCPSCTYSNSKCG